MTTTPNKKTKRRTYGTGSIHKRKNGLWAATFEAGYTPTGKRHRITVTAKDRAKVARKLAAARAAYAEDKTTISPRLTIATWADTWLKLHATQVRPKTYETNASTVKKWIIPTIGKTRVSDITPADVRRVGDAAIQAGRSSTTGRYAQRVLVQMLKAAQQEGVAVPQRVLVAKKLPPAISDRTDIPLDQALKILRVATAREDNARWVAALLQGMRQGEALGLTWEHVDFNRATIDVAWQLQVLKYEDREQGTFKVPLNYESIQLVGGCHLVRPKSQAGTRLIPIVPWMEAALKQWQEIAPDNPWGLVFARPDGMPWSSRMDGDAWKQIQAEAGVSRPDGKPYLLHEARHTTATLLLSAGVEPEVIKAILGHSEIVTQQVYQHVNTDMTRAALEQVAGLLQLDC